MKVERHSFEFKKEVVMAYLNGEGSMQDIADRFGVKGSIQVSRWVMYYTKFGDSGLKSSGQKTYSYEYKLHIVQLYLTSDLSFTPHQERVMRLLEEAGFNLIFLIPYDKRYPFVYEIWDETYSEDYGYPAKDKWHIEDSKETGSF